QEAIWLSTVVGASEVGRTICIDSSFHPPDFTWQWQMPSVEMTPVWDGPHCFEIVEYTWDTLYAHDGEYATYGTAQIALDGDSVSVANVGAGGNDGVTIGFEETAGVTVRFGEQGPIPMGTAVKGLKLVPFPEYCCAYDNYSGGGATPCIDQYPCPNGFSPLPDHTCAPGANNPHLYCAPLIAVENRVADRSVASGAGLSIFGGPNNESATIVPDGCDDPLGYTLYVYNNTVLVDTVVCDSGTTITTDNAMPTAMIFGDMIGLSYSSTMDFVVGGDVYIGDEIRSRPKSAQRSELISRIGIVGRGLVADPELASFSIIDIETASCCVVRGDFTHNGNVDISDLVSLVDFMFTGGPGPLCDEEADLNDDDGVDIADLVYFVEFMFNGGPTPVPCGQSAPINKLVGEVPDISFGIEYNGEASTVLMNSAIDLRGIQLELKGVGPAPENLVGDHVDMVHGRDGWVVRVGLLDLDGGQVVKSDVRQIIRLDGEYTLESVTVADEQARSIRPRIGPIAKHEGLPADYALGQNYPNPFNPSTSIGFALPEAAEVRLEVYNLLGQRVVSLINQRLEAGNHTVQWDSRNESGQAISSGVYFYRLETPRYTKSKKMILLK
ncbi:MAG: T9SS type A sorting domain-containing protein, partial [candidate division Zixibacteria bacterium]|nr:T9SS type A sorting domain-containing protein [candidate division Zixibacteria bacterium]